MAGLYRKYGIRYFRFYDPLFYPNRKDLEAFCTLLMEKRIPVYFRVDIRAGTSRAILKQLWDAGCRVVGFGVESGSPRMLEYLNKRITVPQVNDTLAHCRELGFWTIGFFMVSLPGETQRDRARTRPFFECFDVFNLQFFMLQPGTMVYDRLKQKGEVTDDIWFDRRFEDNIYFCSENFDTATMGADAVKFAIRSAYYRFNMRRALTVMKRHGLIKGGAISGISTILSLTMCIPHLLRIYEQMRLQRSYMALKQAILEKGVQLYG
jgi:hypothetical protein